MIQLWSINRWLRFTGWRLTIEVDVSSPENPDWEPTRIGLVFYGWRGLP